MTQSHRTNATPQIIDLRHNSGRDDAPLRDQIIAGLNQAAGQKTLPSILLYDDDGLRLYDTVTMENDDYYLFRAEDEILRKFSDAIVKSMKARSTESSEIIVVELGAGSLRKTSHVLKALSRQADHGAVYYALDLERGELERTLGALANSDVGAEMKEKVEAKGLCATYAEGISFIETGGLEQSCAEGSPSCHFMFLGSSLGNFERGEDAAFLRSLPLTSESGNTLLLGLDHDNEPRQVKAAYNDGKGLSRQFAMHSLVAAGRALGDEQVFDQEKWDYVGMHNPDLRRHEAYLKSKCDQTVTEQATGLAWHFQADELVRIAVSNKFSDKAASRLFTDANLRPVQRWTDTSSQYSLWLLERPACS